MKDVKYIKYGLFSSILIALGPILWLFMNIYHKNYESIVLNIIFVIIGITLVFYNLRNYSKIYNKKRNIALDLLSHIISFIYYILLLVVMVIAFIGFYIGINLIQEKLFAKREYLIYLIKSPYSYLLFVILTIVASRIGMFLYREEKLSSMNKGLFPRLKIDKVLILTIIPLIYIIITSVVVVTEDGIYDYSFYNLKGNKYSYSDVEYVNTGFVDSGRNKGEFFYNIELKNGIKLELAHPSMAQPSEKYDYDSWQEYVDIDKYVMNSGVKKDSSEKGSNYVQMDKMYIDKLLNVVRNK
ncbi:hypothetical protein DES36_10520 [Alkalibaculum bacchi]|uniref:Uncharacterized protein n=1 Tax=Alkalibaculum bacchi TaxID=645887 RepID=A0A366I9M2_9FIRM|nr:hypothetical protein [Alkalibaculum bacchi]RBP66641.1 hypothetical protein DES36_10520 [Alkalibaculum bacchi]